MLASGGDAGRQARRAGDPRGLRRASLRRPVLRGAASRTAGSSGSARSACFPRRRCGARRRCRCRAARRGRALPARRADRVGRADDGVVDRPRPLVGRLQPDARLLRLRRARPAGRARTPAGADGRRRARRPRRARALLVAAREGDPVALPGRRPRRAAAEPGRLLERARPSRGDGLPARALARRLRGASPVVRVAGALLVYVAELAVVLTYSRAGIAVGARSPRPGGSR